MTKLRQTAQALRDSEDRFAKIFQSGPAPMVISTLKEGRYLEVNDCWLSMLGYSAEEMIGRTTYELSVWVNPDARPPLTQKLLDQGSLRGESIRLRTKNSELRDVHWSAEIVRYSGAEAMLSLFYDFTEHGRMERSLRESEHLYRTLAEKSFAGVYVVQGGCFQFLNRKAAACAGYSVEELIGKESHSIIHPEDREKIKETARRMLKGELNSPYEFRIVTRSGQIRWIQEVVGSIPYQGKPAILGNSMDVTDHKLRDEALKASEKKYRDIFENAVEGIFQTSPEGKLMNANPALARMLGFGSPIDLMENVRDIGKELYADEKDRHRLLRMFGKEGEMRGVELECRTRNGKSIWLSVSLRKARDDQGRIICHEGTAVDITERRAAEEALKESEKKYREIFENAAEGIFQSTPEGRYITVNSSFACRAGYASPEEMIKDVKDIRTLYVNPEERARLHCLLESQGIVRGFETEIYNKEGKKQWISVNVKAVKDDSGEISRYEGTTVDITERKKAEMSLQESEERLRLTFDQSPIGAAMVSPDYRFMRVNDELCRILGYSREELLGLTFQEITHPEDLDEDLKNVERLREGKISRYQLEKRYIRKDGSIICGRLTGSTVRDRRRRLLYFVAMIEDITERKRAEEAFRKSERDYRRIVETAVEGIWIVDADFVITYANQRIAEMLGCGVVDLVGKPIPAFIFPEDMEDYLGKAGQRSRGVKEVFEYRLRRRDGSGCWAIISATPVLSEDGRFAGSFAMMSDITERKQSEEALRQSEERFSKAFRLSPVPTILTTLKEGRFVDANDSLFKLTGFTRDEMDGRTVLELRLWENYEDSRPLVGKMIEQGALRGEAIRIRMKDEAVRDLLWYAEIITVKGERVMLSLIHDITDSKRLEEEKKVLEAQLHQAQKMEAIGTLAGGIAHDFNNILASVIGYTEIVAQRELAPGHPAQRDLKQVLVGCDRAKHLIKQILTFSRQQEKERMPIQVRPVVKEVLKFLKSSLPSTIEIREILSVKTASILADPVQIHQILVNLCTNAAHAMREKGGVLEVLLENVRVGRDEKPLHPDLAAGSYVRLRVSDTGHGIAAEHLPRIFDPFFTTKQKGEGTGLGLSVVYGIVKNHGGVIMVHGEPGKGTAFDIYFPKSEAVSQGPDIRGRSASTLPKGREAILFVDDEKALIEMGHRMLTHLGYRVTGAGNSTEALALFRGQPEAFDLVITDQTMPHMTGAEMAGEMLKIRPDVPIFLCTGYSEAITPAKARSIGIREFLLKPVGIRDLARVIRKTLDGEGNLVRRA